MQDKSDAVKRMRDARSIFKLDLKTEFTHVIADIFSQRFEKIIQAALLCDIKRVFSPDIQVLPREGADTRLIKFGIKGGIMYLIGSDVYTYVYYNANDGSFDTNKRDIPVHCLDSVDTILLYRIAKSTYGDDWFAFYDSYLPLIQNQS